MKRILLALIPVLALNCLAAEPQDGISSAELKSARQPERKTPYVVTDECRKARKDFADSKFGIFIHWGIYSMFAQGEWYLQNSGMHKDEYAKAARGFYPADFNARQWVAAVKDAGAKYITITSRHHDGFSMWDTNQSPYNIVDATPFGRDILRELADECQQQGIKLNFYYSHIDWTRDDYPTGMSGQRTGKSKDKEDWPAYYQFMNNQLTELLTAYGPVGAIWFDGLWDHQNDSIAFDWHLEEQYDLIHRLQPGCLIANNHHCSIIEGEDIQLFERDLPGENKAGFSGQEVAGNMPLETCQTINNNWGYRAVDTKYKDTQTLIHLLVRAAGMGANLLLNVGPQPSGAIPDEALTRLHEIGDWLRKYGESFYATSAGPIAPQPWGCTTRRDNMVYIHITDPSQLENPSQFTLNADRKIAGATMLQTGEKLKVWKGIISLPEFSDSEPVHTIAVTLKK